MSRGVRVIPTRLSPAQAARIAAAEARRVEAAALVQPVVINGRTLTATQRDRLIEAERLAGGGLSERRKAASLVRSVEAELAAAREARAVDAGIDETLTLASRRGEAFEIEAVDIGEWRRDEDGCLVRRHGLPVLDVQTVRRASRVDGLASLYKAGAIRDEEKRTGDDLRRLWDAVRPPVVSGGLERSSGGQPDKEAGMAAAVLRGFVGLVLGEVEARIGDARTFAVLEGVAGRGLTIRSFGDGGDLKAANRERLITGLRVAAEVLSDPKWKRLANQAR